MKDSLVTRDGNLVRAAGMGAEPAVASGGSGTAHTQLYQVIRAELTSRVARKPIIPLST